MTTKKTTEMKASVTGIMDAIEALTITEVADLANALREKYGLGAATFAAPGGAGATAATSEAAPKAEEKTEFSVTLVSVGDKKIQVLKELRALTGLGLKEAKDIIDKTPSVIKEAAPKEEAGKIKAKLEEVGAKVEVK